jgi:hypothetical protein
MRTTDLVAVGFMGLLLVACSTPANKYGADSVDRIDKADGSTPTYLAMGKLDFSGQDPASKATRVMTSACPSGHPALLASTAQKITTASFDGVLFTAMFTCDVPIPDEH